MKTIKIYGATELSKELADYNRVMKRAGITADKFDDINEYIKNGMKITHIQNTYEKQGRKSFPKNPTTTTTEEIDARRYACYISSIGFFHDRITKNDTVAGYIPTRLVCTSPDHEKKVENIFKFEM